MPKFTVKDSDINPIMIGAKINLQPNDFHDGIKRPRKSTAEIVAETIKGLVPGMIVEGLKPIAATLKEQGEAVARLDNKLTNVIKLNNLKS
ncbi:hypothetical protein FACS1894166_05190 [Bacilli bacterium]|nr:hypothetical protein FACS1894166_05190 [Bacilli bacterium]